MNKIILYLLLSILVVSCASKRDFDDLEGDFDWIDNSDFIPEPEIKYNASEDVFDDDIGSYDSLSHESIARLPEPKLEKVSEKKNPITSAIGLCYRKKINEAFKIFDQNYERYKSHPSYWNQIGTCYYILGNYRKSLLYYNKAKDLNDKYIPALNNLGVLYQKEGHDQKALIAFKKANNINPFAVTPSFNLAQIYLKYGLIDKAIKIFAGLAQKNSQDVDLVNGLATCYLFKGDVQKALSYFYLIDDDALERADVSLNYAVALKLTGKEDDARDVFSEIDRSNLGSLAGYYRKVAGFIGVR